MAFVGNQQTPDQEQNLSAPAGTTSANPLATLPPSQSGSAGSGTGGGGSPNVGTSKQFGAPASKLGDYLSANAPQIQGQANKTAGQIGNQYNQVNSDVTNAANQFGQQVSQGYTAANPDLLAQEAANPTNFASNAGNVAGFQAQLNDQYTGPQNFESTTPYANVQNEVQNAVSNAGLWNSPGGIYQATAAQNPNNNQGINTLDATLLQTSPQAMATVQQAAQPFQNLPSYLQQAVQRGDMSVQQAQQAATGASQAAKQQLQGQVTGLNTQIGNENTTAYNTANTNYQNLLDQINGDNLSPATQGLLDKANKILQTPGHDNNAATQALNDYKAALAKEQGTQKAASGAMGMPLGGGDAANTNNMGQLMTLERQLETPTFINSANAGNGSAWTQGQNIPLNQYLTGNAPLQSQFTGASDQDIATGNALNQLAGSNVFTAPAANTYTAPTFDSAAALAGLQNALTGQQQGATTSADQLAAQQQTQHEASLGGGLLSGPLGDLGKYLANPIAEVPKEFQYVKGKI